MPDGQEIETVDAFKVDPVASGTFVIYPDGRDGFVLVTDMPNQGGIRRQHIPAALVKMFAGGGMIGGKLSGMLGGLFRG